MAIPNDVQTHHHIGDVVEHIPMGMRAQDFTHLAFMFENQYSNPIAACVREYSTNAWDSHVLAGNPDPIEVTLPTVENPFLVIQDRGIGMSMDTMREIFANYGASEKRGTNAVAGQLGIGSKSALAYAPSFLVTAVSGGVKATIQSTKDGRGFGELQVIDTCATDEPNGVKITIPVDLGDVDQFRSEAERLFQFWEPGTVLIDGEAPAVPDWRQNALMLDDDTMLIHPNASDLWSSYVIMGNVPYPVDDAELGRGVTRRFVARLNIGDVDFAPSREDVRHTPHTTATLRELTEYIRDTFKRTLTRTLATVQTRWEEAALKVLWMDRGMRLDANGGAPIWHYHEGGWGHRKARAHLRYTLRDLAQPKLTVITGFPGKSLSTSHRERLREFAGANATFIIIPDTVASGVLDGRPNTFTWDKVVGVTQAPMVAKAKEKRAKYETIYSILGQPGMTVAQLAEVKGKVLYMDPGDRVTHGDLGCTVVQFRTSTQLARVKRYVPKIKPYQDEVDRQRAKAAKAVTDQDKAIVRARTLPTPFHDLNPDDVLDPELAEALRLRKAPDTKTMLDARTFGVEVKGGSVAQLFTKRYPLIDNDGYYHSMRVTKKNLPDFLLYLNAKYDQITDPALDVKAS